MRLNQQPRLQQGTDYSLTELFRSIAQKVNGLADGSMSEIDNAATGAPTTDQHMQGDYVRNKAPTELGAVGSKYIIFQWTCVVSGTPGTWVQSRFLTGN